MGWGQHIRETIRRLKADKANKKFIASVNSQREASLLGKTKTDYTGDLKKPAYTGDLKKPVYTGDLKKPAYTGDLKKPVYTGDLSKTDEDSDETIGKLLSRPLLAKRRKLLGM